MPLRRNSQSVPAVSTSVVQQMIKKVAPESPFPKNRKKNAGLLMPSTKNSTTPNPLLEKRRGLLGCFIEWSPTDDR